MGKSHFCNSVGPSCSGSSPQVDCGHWYGGSACIGCTAPCQAQGRPEVSKGCCPTETCHSGGLLHKASPERCPWRVLVMALMGAPEGGLGLCPGVRDFLGELLLAMRETDRVGLGSHPPGRCSRNREPTGCAGVRVEAGSARTGSVHEQQSVPNGDLPESQQKATHVVCGREVRNSTVPP